ncbi:MAG: hypothetical protein KJ737_10675 [Proteobacteria bacterium]|nr:hypothetical protein [Pseudomonadota bacterium]
MKKIWLTALDSSKENAQKFMTQMKPYGLQIDGHLWTDDLWKTAWFSSREDVIDPNNAVWAIMTSDKELQSPTNRYGISLLGMTLQARKGSGFPVVIIQTGGVPLSSDNLPTVLKGADVLLMSNPGLGAKLTAKVHAPVKPVLSEYRLDICGNEHIGQWFETGPQGSFWKGAIFGVCGAEIIFHAVGKKGELPKTSQLNYPVKGMKIQLGEKEYVSWAVQNEIAADLSYYVKVDGFPEAILFGAYPDEAEADLYVINLK